MITQETKSGPTPNGGDKSTIYYQDSTGSPTDKSTAQKAEIIEYKGDEEIHRTYMRRP